MDAQVNFKAQEQAVEGFVSALQELKAMMKSINDLPITRLKGVDQSLVSPMQEAVKKLAESGVAMVNTMKASQAQMVKNLKATNKEMQAEVEKSASELVKAQARAMEEGAKRTEGAWRGELAMVNRMYDLKSKAQAKALKELADAQAKAMSQAEAANLKAWSDDLKGFQQMLKLKVAADKAAATATEKARADDLKGFQQMLKLKLAAEAAATKQSEVQTVRAQAKALEEGAKRTEAAWRSELAMVNRMYDLRARAQAKALKELADAQAKAATSAERANLKALSDDLKGFQQMMKLKVAAANSAAAELAAVNARVAASSARVQVNNAMAAPAGAYSSLAPGARFGTLVAPAPSVAPSPTKYKSPAKELADGLDDVSNKSSKAGGPLKALTNHLTDVHSAARGVASGFGLMWLTWGRLTPLLAGAALSNSLVQTAQKGKEFETVLAGIEYMGGASAAEIKQLSSAALELGATTKYGPIEVAEGLKVLSLAGLNATESLQALKPTLDFATVSELPLDKATESILGISKAFGYTAAEVSVSGDVVAKAAAVSMSAVSDMTEAFKQSSTVAQQFGVTIQDQSTMLALLAQIGIRGSAAGTAVRNMYVELMGSSKKARKVLEETLNVNIFDNATKAVKPLSTVMADLAKALSGKTFEAQTRILNDLGNERGMKSIAAGLSAIQAEAIKSGKSLSEFTSVFAAMQKELEDAPGFMAIAAAGMAATTENIMKSVGGSLQSSMIKAFEEMSPYLINFSIALRDVFRSPEFIQGLKDMVRFVGESAQTLAAGAKFVWEFRDAILAAGVGLVALKASTAVIGAMSTVVAGAAATVKLLTASFLIAGPAGFAGAAGATAMAGAVNLLKVALGPIAIALSAAAAAYYFFADSAADASKKQAQEAIRNNDETRKALEAKRDMTLEAMDKEIERLQVYIKHKGDEKKINEEMKKLADEASVSAVNSTIQKLLDMAQQQEATRKTEAATKRLLAAEVERDTFLGHAYNGDYAARLRKEADALDEQGRMIRAKGEFEANVARQRQVYMSKLAKEAAGIANNNAANRRRPTTGDGTYNPDDGSARKERAAVLKTQLNGELQQIMQRYADEVSTIKAAEQNAQNLLKASHDAKLINSGEFYARELQLATESEAKQLALIEESSAAYTAQQIKDAETLQSRYASTIEKLNKNKDLTGEQREEAKVAATQALEAALIQMGDAAVTAWQKFNNDGKSIRDGAITRMELQAIKARGELKALNKASEDFWLAERIRQNDAASATAVEDALRYASPEQAAYIQATAAENSRLTAEMRKLQEQYELARESLNGYTNEMLNSEIITEQMKQGEVDRIAVLKELKKQMDELAGKSSGMVDAAGVSALTKLRKDDEAQLVKGVANAVETGLFEGGKAGKKKLRDLIVAELRKPVTLLINAVINPIMGALLGSMGLGSAVAGQAGGSLLGSAATSFGGSTLSTSIFGAGGVTGFATSVGEGVAASLAGSSGIPLASAGSTAFNIGAALPGVGAALLALNAFGVFRSKKIVGNGLMGTLGEGDIQSYDLQRKGGTLFSGPSYSFRNQQKSAWSDMIQADWRRATASVVGMAESLGLATDAADGFTATLGTDVLNYDDPGIRGIKLDDLRGQNLTEAQYAQAVQDRVNEAILTGSEQLAQKLIGSWETTTQTIAKKVQVVGLEGEVTWETVNETVTTTTYKVSEFARSNETALQTLTRLSTSLVLVNRHFANLGFTLKDKSLAGGDAASSFVDRFGGQENFDRVAGNYYQNYYSDAERQARGVQILNDEFKRIGVTMPRTTAGLRTMVDAAMAAGDEKLASDLLKVSEGFYAIQGRVEEQRRDLESQLLQAQGKTAELRALELSKLDASNRALQQHIWALEDEAQAAEDAAAAASTANDALQASIDRARQFFDDFAGKLSDVSDTLGSAAKNIRDYLNKDAIGGGPKSLQNVSAAFESQLVFAKGGDREALAGITGYADTLIQTIRRTSATQEESNLKESRVRAKLAALPSQISAEQYIVDAIDRQTFNLSGTLTTSFTSLDANVDGLLTFEELKAAGLATDGKIGDVIAALDANGDGQISAIEALKGTLSLKFDAVDTSLNGLLSYDEFSSAFVGLASDSTLRAIFTELDTNGDGQISRLEVLNMSTNQVTSAVQQLSQSLAGQLASGFDSIDLNPNGLIDYNEFRNAFSGMATDATLRQIFTELDVNGDGTISRLEAIRGSSGETASNTYGLDKLTRISDVINSLQWGTEAADAASVTALSTIAKQQGWTADDMSKALNRFSGPEIAAFFAKYGKSITVGGLGGGSSTTTAGGSLGLTPGSGGFVIGGGGGSSQPVGTTIANPNTYTGALGTPIYDAATIDRLDSINGYVNSLDWGAGAAASAWETFQAAQTYGVTQQELAVSTGYNLSDIQALFDSAGVPRFAAGGMHSGGLRVVGENGWEIEATGASRIWNQSQIASALGGGDSGERTANAISRSMEAQQAQHRALMDLLGRMVRLHERWDRTGIPETRTTPAAVPV